MKSLGLRFSTILWMIIAGVGVYFIWDKTHECDKSDCYIVDNPNLTQITVADANTFVSRAWQNYTDSTHSTMAFSISKTMLDKAVAVQQENPTNVKGIRFYYGKSNSSLPTDDVAVIVGIDQQKKDLTNYIQATSAAMFDRCPIHCDYESPIMPNILGDNPDKKN